MREALSESSADRIGHDDKDDWYCACFAGQGMGCGSAPSDDRIGFQTDECFRQVLYSIGIARAPAHFKLNIVAFGPTELR